MSAKDGTERLCKCGYPIGDGDNHPMCLLCLGVHEMTKCSICKSMSTAVKALRRRLYNEAKSSGYVLRDGQKLIFPPLPQSGVQTSQVRSVEDSVSSYFSGLPDRERDDMRDKDDREFSSLSAQERPVEQGASTPISQRNLSVIPAARVAELQNLFNLNQAQLDTLRDQRSPQSQRVAQILQSAQEELAQTGQVTPRFDYSHQAAGSDQVAAQFEVVSQQEVVDLEAQSEVPSISPVPKVVTPIRRPRKRPPPVAPKVPIPPKKPRLAATRMDTLERDVSSMKGTMESFMTRFTTFMQNPQQPARVPTPRLHPSTFVPPLVPQGPRRPAAPTPVPAPIPVPAPVPAPVPVPPGQNTVQDPPILPRPRDAYQIPRTQSTLSLNYSRTDEYGSQPDLLNPEDLARSEVRQQWLAHVRDLLVDVPDMEPTPEPSTIGTHIYSLAPKSKKLKMPLLTEVKEVVDSFAEKQQKNFNNVVKKYYPVHESLEKTFMSVRDVPLEVITEVPAANLQNVGASASTARLKKTSIGGVQEEMAIEQAQFAVSSMRLVNSNILSMSSLRQLLSSVTDQVDCLVEEDDNPDRFSNLRSDLQLMGHAIVDMDGGNGDLLKITASQFNEAHRTRSNAWIEATKLPNQMKKKTPELIIPDSHISAVSRAYYKDEHFQRDSNGSINLWNLYNLLTGAVKASYIDKFLGRNINTGHFIQGIASALDGRSSHNWFLS